PNPQSAEDFEYTTLAAAAAVTPLEQLDGGGTLFWARLREDWCIGVVPQGGYLTTLLLNATTFYFTYSPSVCDLNQPHPIHCALAFATRCSPGPATVRVTPLKLGRQYSFVRVELLQDSLVCIDATIVHANMSLESGATLQSRGMGMYGEIPDRVRDCKPAEEDSGNKFGAATYKLLQVFPKEGVDGSGWRGRPLSIREQWVKLRDGSNEGFGLTDLGFVCDMFKPIPESYPEAMRRHWYPTLSLGMEIKMLPPFGGWEWLYVRIESCIIRNGRMDLEVVICDEKAQVVAISKHMALILDVSRNRIK
ncbi:hypothetical protein K440DRAFT_490208, partial [Wilcoxina mikolae CBS 423.85]